MGLHAVTQFWDVNALLCAVLVSTFLSADLMTSDLGAVLSVVEAFWMRLETAAEATSLKSASVDARLTPPADNVEEVEVPPMGREGLYPVGLDVAEVGGATL